MNINNLFGFKAIYKELEEYLKIIDDLLAKVHKRVEQAPSGSLRISKSRNTYQYFYKSKPGEVPGTYLKRKNHDLAVLLAQKNYDNNLIKELIRQEKALESFLKYFDPDSLQKVYEDLTVPLKQLVSSEILTDDEYIKTWLNTPYSHLGFAKDDPEFYTAKGERVRSKSEILIADALLRHNIPYRYEYPVYSHGVMIAAPDFNCLNVRIRKDYYWEHLGMMGMEKYADRNTKKINKYFLADDFDEDRLILTMETDNIPLNTRVIEQKIRKYLL